jgi:addiction module RelE/StbE family toxin
MILAAVSLLAKNQPLPVSNYDHPLVGEWAGYRECHLKPDLLLVYRLVRCQGQKSFGVRSFITQVSEFKSA